MSSARPLLTPEQIVAREGSNFPTLVLPDRSDFFAHRAQRLRQLARGHSMQGYLEFIGQIAAAQQIALDHVPSIIPTPANAGPLDRSEGIPLDASTHARDPLWIDQLRTLLQGLATESTGTARAVVDRIASSPDNWIEAQAERLLASVTLGLDTAAAPLIAAGLQVYFTHRLLSLDQAAFELVGPSSLCPCCGSRPTASVGRIGGDSSGLRFLQCSLCSLQWHMVRIKCARCQGTKGISYLHLDDAQSPRKPAMLAECCGTCGFYLKIGHMDRDPNVDTIADDLATLALDILVAEAGYEPWGVNLMLIHGDPSAEPATFASLVEEEDS